MGAGNTSTGSLKRTWWLLCLPVIAFIISFALGRYPVGPGELIKVLFNRITPIAITWDTVIETVVFQIRLPRITAAMVIGAALTASGAAYQGMFRNPLISPDILGASAGAGFGAALAIYLSLGIIGIQIFSFIGGLIAVMLTCMLSSRIRHDPTLALVLTGILVGTIFSSCLSLTKYLADPYDKLPTITFWLMGSLASIRPRALAMASIAITIGAVPIYLLRWRINVLSMGEDEARVLGVNTRRMRQVIIFGATLMTSASVAVSGMIGWVGLIMPHLARLIVGLDYRKLLPYSMVLGSTYLVMVDNLARMLTQEELPLGILTSVIGAPFFMYLLLYGKGRWQ